MNKIFINEVGFLKDQKKKAVLNFKAESFGVYDCLGKKVYSGLVSHFGTDEISGEDVYNAEFDALKDEGTYYIDAEGVKSPLFTISDGVYDKLMQDLLKTYYFLRCGAELEEKYAGEYTHKPCHLGLAKVYGDEDTKVEVTGGWHDAGDYGRYMTAGCVAVAHLLYGFRFYKGLKDIEFNIPKEKGLPDILTEVKVEIEFLRKLQKEDGSCYHKVTTMRHADFIMPEEDTSDLYLFPVSSIATADFAAMCALSYTVYKDYDKAYAENLLSLAEKAYEWLLQNPKELLFHNPKESNTGEYDEAEDISNRFWAAAALYDATKEKAYLQDALKQKERLIEFNKTVSFKGYQGNVFTCLGWAEVAGLGGLSVLLNKEENELYTFTKEAFIEEADRLCKNSKKNGFYLCMEKKDFIWGSNMELGKYLMILSVAFALEGKEKYRTAIENGFDYLLGCNSMDVSYVTGNGEHAYKNPHLRPTAVDGIEEPWPGLVSGGPNIGLQDEKARELSRDLPAMKCYLDDVACYSLNEITIYWNSPFIFALAGLIC